MSTTNSRMSIASLLNPTPTSVVANGGGVVAPINTPSSHTDYHHHHHYNECDSYDDSDNNDCEKNNRRAKRNNHSHHYNTHPPFHANHQRQAANTQNESISSLDCAQILASRFQLDHRFALCGQKSLSPFAHHQSQTPQQFYPQHGSGPLPSYKPTNLLQPRPNKIIHGPPFFNNLPAHPAPLHTLSNTPPTSSPSPSTTPKATSPSKGLGPTTPLKQCTNCNATKTPSWRRCKETNVLLCNACGLYRKLHKKTRVYRKLSNGRTRAFHHPDLN